MVKKKNNNDPLKDLYTRIAKSKWYQKLRRSKLKPMLDKIIHPDTSPYTTAISMATGTFIGIFIPVGLQLAVTVLVSPIKHINFLITSITTLISNPLTVLPIYAFGIKVGTILLNRSFPWMLFNNFVNHPAFNTLLSFGVEGLSILMTGLLAMAIPASIVVFFVSLSITKKIRQKKGIAN